MKRIYQKPELDIVEFLALESIASSVNGNMSNTGDYDEDYDPWGDGE